MTKREEAEKQLTEELGAKEDMGNWKVSLSPGSEWKIVLPNSVRRSERPSLT